MHAQVNARLAHIAHGQVLEHARTEARTGTHPLAVQLEAPPSVQLERDMLFTEAGQWSPLSTTDRELDREEAYLPD